MNWQVTAVLSSQQDVTILEQTLRSLREIRKILLHDAAQTYFNICSARKASKSVGSSFPWRDLIALDAGTLSHKVCTHPPVVF